VQFCSALSKNVASGNTHLFDNNLSFVYFTTIVVSYLV